MKPLTPSLELAPELRKRVDNTILDRVRHAMAVCADRDDLLRGYQLQVDGLQQPLAAGPWRGSCQLDDPITLEHKIALDAYLEAALRNEPYWLIEAQDPVDAESAARLEQALTSKARQWRLRERLYDVIYNATQYPFAVLYVGWQQQWGKRRYTAYLERETGREVEESEISADAADAYTPLLKSQRVLTYEGPELRAVAPEDFYVYPPDCADLDRAQLLVERMYLTQEDLLMGVRERGYDEDAVTELLRRGPSWIEGDSERADRNERDGIEAGSNGDGY